jgi:preprotein translocase subunit SecF
LSKGKQQRRKQIKAELAMGERRYVFHRGVIDWGVPTYLLYLVLTVVLQHFFSGYTWAEAVKSLFPLSLIFGLVIFTLTGVFIGKQRWKQLKNPPRKRPNKKNKSKV